MNPEKYDNTANLLKNSKEVFSSGYLHTIWMQELAYGDFIAKSCAQKIIQGQKSR